MKPRPEEDLVGINVPNPRDNLLAHQQGLQPAARRPEQLQELITIDRQGIMAEPSGRIPLQSRLVEQRQAPESSRIPVSDF